VKFLIGLFALSILFSSIHATAAPQFTDVSIPNNAEAPLPIPVSVNITSEVNISGVFIHHEMEGDAWPTPTELNLINGSGMGGTWSGEIPARNRDGTLTYSILVFGSDPDYYIAKYPSQGYATIVLEGAPSDVPWSLIIIIGFLAFVLIATELAFKPGFWRPTGREKARALEEEDRRKAEEKEEPSNENPGKLT
jgi:hypothetical protein